MAVDTYRRALGNFYGDIVASVWKNHLVIQNLSAQEEGNGRENLRKGRVSHYGDIYHSIVWNGIRSLSEAQSATYAHGHNPVLFGFIIDSIFHLPEHTLEEQKNKRNDV